MPDMEVNMGKNQSWYCRYCGKV